MLGSPFLPLFAYATEEEKKSSWLQSEKDDLSCPSASVLGSFFAPCLVFMATFNVDANVESTWFTLSISFLSFLGSGPEGDDVLYNRGG